MDVTFDRGDRDRPRGHALLYFRSASDPEEIWVTYVVILPISVDVSKYVPPFLMNQVGNLSPKELSAFAFPPAPERLGAYSALDEIASQRDDDILFAGQMDPNDVPSAMMSINEVVQAYAEVYAQVAGVAEPSEPSDPDESSGVSVNEVLYGLMSESDKLGELTKLVGSLRFAMEGSDDGGVKEVEADIGVLSRHLPDNHYIPELVAAVKSSEQRGAALADLYLQRCYHLVQEDYAKVSQIETKIREMEEGE